MEHTIGLSNASIVGVFAIQLVLFYPQRILEWTCVFPKWIGLVLEKEMYYTFGITYVYQG